MKKILPVILIILGVVGGGAAGMFLKPPAKPAEGDGAHAEADVTEGGAHGSDGAGGDGHAAEGPQPSGEPLNADGERDYVKIGKQIIIPIVEGGETRALMLFELAVDVPLGQRALVVEREPRLRDAFLRELFEMSYTGAFMSNFTDDRVIEELRRNLLAAARAHIGKAVSDVLILDVMRQELS